MPLLLTAGGNATEGTLGKCSTGGFGLGSWAQGERSPPFPCRGFLEGRGCRVLVLSRDLAHVQRVLIHLTAT